jgi:hypothetical protein
MAVTHEELRAELRRLLEDAWRATALKKVVRRYDSAQG